MQKALFLDRDGIINVDHGYVSRIEDFEFVDGIFELVSRFCLAGFLPIVVTNQSGIARGYYSEKDFNALSSWMQEKFKERGIKHLPVYFCPHHASAGIGDYQTDCDCRKPKPGMLLQAKADYDIDLTESVLIGDSWRDIQAGQSANLKQMIFVSNSDPRINNDYSAIAPKLVHTTSVRDCLTRNSELLNVTL